jgi:hypothetical protein
MFTTGQIIFATLFLIIFVVGMLWSYKKDSFSNTMHFKGASKILWIVGIAFLLLVFYVKVRHFL